MALIGGPPPLLSLLAGCVAVRRSFLWAGGGTFRFLCVAALLTWAGVRFVTQRGPSGADPKCSLIFNCYLESVSS
jgi:hypothetical protein